MAKAEWGLKRVCNRCRCRFYDLQRAPITCPSCAATHDPDLYYKAKRLRSSAPELKQAAMVSHDDLPENLVLDDVDTGLGDDDDSLLEVVEDIGDDEVLEEVIDDIDEEV